MPAAVLSGKPASSALPVCASPEIATPQLLAGQMAGHAWLSPFFIRASNSLLIYEGSRGLEQRFVKAQHGRLAMLSFYKTTIDKYQAPGYDIARSKAHSSSGLGHRPLKAEITGSNPVCATKRPWDPMDVFFRSHPRLILHHYPYPSTIVSRRSCQIP